VVNTTITEVGSATNALILGASCSSDGVGNTSPRGQVDFALTSTTNVSETRSETSRDERRFYTVFEWPVGLSVVYRGGREMGVWRSSAVLEHWAARGELGTWDSKPATMEAYKFTGELREGFGEAQQQ